MITWLVFTFLSIFIQGFFALFEMACVSFNKIRLQYYVSQKNKRATWIHYLLKRPSRLFGTTLIGINASLQIGSECARRFYESIHLDPDWAPISQVFLVVVLGELVPLFTARRHPERIAIFFAPFMVFLARLFFPFIWIFDHLSRSVHRLVFKPPEAPLFLSREEVKMAFRETDQAKDAFGPRVEAIFQLKNLVASQLMLPLAEVKLFPFTITVSEARKELIQDYVPILPLFNHSTHQVVAIVQVRDLLSLEEHQKIAEKGKSPWFVTQNTSILQLLDQFRRNNQNIAVILEPSGKAVGILTLDQIVDAVFGPEELFSIEEPQHHFIDRTLDASMTVGEFNRRFEADLTSADQQTLAELLIVQLDHPPAKGEIIRLGNYEFTVLEPTLRGIKTLSVRSLQE